MSVPDELCYLQKFIQSADYFSTKNLFDIVSLNVIQIKSCYDILDEDTKRKVFNKKTAISLIDIRNELAHEIVSKDTMKFMWETLKTDLYQIDTKLKKILGDDYTIISEIPTKELEEVSRQIHADIIIQNDQNVAIMHSIADTPKLQQIHDNFLLKEKQFQTEKKKQITERFTDTLQIIIDDYNNIQNQINRRKTKLSKLEQEIQEIGEQKHSPEALTVKIEELQKQKQMLEKTLKSYITIKDSLPKSKL